MLIEIPEVLDTNRLDNILKVLKGANFLDGKASAGRHAQKVKNNLEMDQNSQQARYLDELLVGALAQNSMFRNATLPLRVSQPFFARYEPGMHYGDHVDDPVMGDGAGRYRTDVSVTVFLSPPESYEGGELVINTSYGTRQVKLPAGYAVCYPSASLHHVNEVTSGERLVAVLWIQSMIRDALKRELLYNLNLAREKLMDERASAEETAQVDHTYTNLVRMWSEI